MHKAAFSRSSYGPYVERTRRYVFVALAFSFLLPGAAEVSFAQTSPATPPPHALVQPGAAPGQSGSDTLITAKARAALIGAAGIDSTHIHVSTQGGVVTLTGVVPDRKQKDQATHVVEQLDNVVGVKNSLDVDMAPQ